MAKENLQRGENDKLDEVDECVTLLPASSRPAASGQDQRGFAGGRNRRGRLAELLH